MGAPITRTGRPTGPIVETSPDLRFAMEEGGAPAPPTGVPPASVLTFSVFVAKKADSPGNLISGCECQENGSPMCPSRSARGNRGDGM